MLKIKGIDVFLGNKQILKSVDLEVKKGEFLSLLGASGCGKSTLLKTVCGFTEHQSGTISIDGECIDKVPIHLRNTVMVFQDLRLFPNMLAWENVAFSLKMRKVKKDERKKVAYDLLKQVELEGLEHRKVYELSGGQQQRVALARAFAAKPRILLLDEPFSGLDEDLKVEMRKLLLELHKKHGITIIFVTHDKAEAMTLSDRVVTMCEGVIIKSECIN